MVKDFTAGFRIDQAEYETFKKKCKDYNLPASTVLRLFIQAFNDERVHITDIIKEA